MNKNLGMSTGSMVYDADTSVAPGGGDAFAVGHSAKMIAPSAPPSPEGTRQLAADMAGTREESGTPNQNVADRLIIKTGFLSLVVKDVLEGVGKIHAFAKSKGGFVVSSNISKDGLAPYAEVTIRIPSEVFDGGVQEVKAMGEVKSERVNGQDVTEEYTDLSSQLRNLRVSETQFLEIMKRAQKIEDVLAVQRELTRIQGEIEVLLGRIKYLEQSAKLSTLTVYLATDPQNLPVVDSDDKWKPVAVFKDALRSLVEFGKGIVDFVIWLVVYIPVWTLIALVVWIIRKWWKKQFGSVKK